MRSYLLKLSAKLLMSISFKMASTQIDKPMKCRRIEPSSTKAISNVLPKTASTGV